MNQIQCPYIVPSKQEVLDSRRPLNVMLYASLCVYCKKPTIPQGPQFKTFADRLKNHVLLEYPWIKEKGFLKVLSEANAQDISPEELIDIIQNNEVFLHTPKLTQQLLIFNLLLAYKDCSELC